MRRTKKKLEAETQYEIYKFKIHPHTHTYIRAPTHQYTIHIKYPSQSMWHPFRPSYGPSVHPSHLSQKKNADLVTNKPINIKTIRKLRHRASHHGATEYTKQQHKEQEREKKQQTDKKSMRRTAIEFENKELCESRRGKNVINLKIN